MFVIERWRINKFSNFSICYSFSLPHHFVQDECSVQNLIENCIIEDDKLYICVSSPTIKNKPVQIRPWRLSDADFVLDASMSLDPRKTVFVGGVPRPLKACKFTQFFIFKKYFQLNSFSVELAMIMDRLYGGVCYAGIDTDPELKYPKVRDLNQPLFCNFQTFFLLSGCWSRGFLQSAELHCCHLGSLRSVAAWRHRQARWSQAVRSRRSNVWRVRRTALQWQVCTILLC